MDILWQRKDERHLREKKKSVKNNLNIFRSTNEHVDIRKYVWILWGQLVRVHLILSPVVARLQLGLQCRCAVGLTTRDAARDWGERGVAAAPREGHEQGMCFPHHCITKMYSYQRQHSPIDQKKLVWSRVAFDNLSRQGRGVCKVARSENKSC